MNPRQKPAVVTKPWIESARSLPEFDQPVELLRPGEAMVPPRTGLRSRTQPDCWQLLNKKTTLPFRRTWWRPLSESQAGTTP